MKEQDDDHRAGAVGVQAAEEGSSRYSLGDVSNGRVGMIGGRNVVQSKEHARDHLRYENEEQSGAKYVSETGAAGNRFIESASQQIIHACAAVQPSPYSRFARRSLAGVGTAHQPITSLSETSCRKYWNRTTNWAF